MQWCMMRSAPPMLTVSSQKGKNGNNPVAETFQLRNKAVFIGPISYAPGEIHITYLIQLPIGSDLRETCDMNWR
jgi:hypothetical protein